MTNEPEQLDAIEDALLELESAEKAGVFNRTRIEARDVLRVDPACERVGLRRRLIRWMPVAAAVGIAAVVWTSVFDVRHGSVSPPAPVVTVLDVAVEDDGCDGSFLGCFSGPKNVIVASCLAHDYDADGDVDLVDFGAYQLEYKRLTQTR